MAPAIKDELTNTPTKVEEDELMEEVEEEEDPQENEEDQEMAEENDNDVIVSADKVEVISGAHGDDQTAMTFCFKEEDHTLGNALRHMITKNPRVELTGYSIPHPSEAKMNLRIQTTDETTAIEALKKGLGDLHDMCAHIKDTYEVELRNAKTLLA